MGNLRFNGIFCDDVRHEVGNKFTLVGCYGRELYVPEFPTTIRRICVHFNVLILDSSPPEYIKVELLKDDIVSSAVELDIEHSSNEIAHRSMLNGGFELLDLEVEDECELELVATIGGARYHGAYLSIKQLPAENSSENPAIVSN